MENSEATKVALVTGASGGIGRQIALRLAEDGYDLVVHYNTNESTAQAVVSEIQSLGRAAYAVQADLSSVEEIRAMFATIKKISQRLDAFINNAGVPAQGVPMSETDEEIFDRVFATNTKGTFFALSEAANLLSDGGRIINMSSSTTYFPTANLAVYTASKAAVKTYTEVLAKEIGSRDITVNTVSPGPTVPGMFEWAPEELRSEAAASSPFNRLGTPDDISGVISFLASDDARWVSGQQILVNGGASI
ncbi:MAG: SDR family oxidoreductase [Parasphingorhabdus sp.]